MPRKTLLTIGLLALLSLALPRTREWLGWRKQEPAKVEPEKAEPEAEKPEDRAPTIPEKHPLLADPAGNLRTFYQALLRSEMREPGAITRVLHYGDSPTTADSITADVRELLQRRFGDGGHGFVLVSPPWAWYGHRGIKIRSRGWKDEPASQGHRAKDRLHGLGGVSSTGAAGASATIELPDDSHTRMEVLYLKQPGGGGLRVTAEDVPIAEISTAAEEKASGFAEAPLPPGTRSVTVTAVGGRVRVFGVVFEKKGPGLIYHSLGLNGASVQMALRFFDRANWTEQLQHQNPDLVVINYGSNETFFARYVESTYPKELEALLVRVREALPKTSILVMSPMDRGERDKTGTIVTPPILPRLVEAQRKVALANNCAFFNTFEAMGGAGTMAKWYQAKPRLVSADFLHPLPQGAAKVGKHLEQALLEGYDHWKAVRSR